jgi:hypothetical protein
MVALECALHCLIAFWGLHNDAEFLLGTSSLFIMLTTMTLMNVSGIGIQDYFCLTGYTIYITCKLYNSLL